MKTRSIVAAALLGFAATAGAAPVTRTYKVVADLSCDVGSQLVTQPNLEIPNPKANSTGITVTGVDIVWNPAASSTLPYPGVTKHAAGTRCTRVSTANAIALPPGEGITIDGLASLAECGSTSCNQVCQQSWDCPSGCFCIIRWPTGQGNCLTLTPAAPVADRITFEVTRIDDSVNGAPPAVRSTVLTSDFPIDTIKGVKGGEVDMDSRQR